MLSLFNIIKYLLMHHYRVDSETLQKACDEKRSNSVNNRGVTNWSVPTVSYLFRPIRSLSVVLKIYI